MKKNRELVYEYLWKESLATGKDAWKTEEIAEALSMQRTNVSTLLNELTAEGLLEKSKTRPVIYRVAHRNEKSVENKPFEDMIGFDGSMKKAVDDAKKAIMYPAESLNIQVVTGPGTGATTFCKNIYYYGLLKGKFGQNNPYIYVNCRHFKRNSSYLNDLLFGDESGLGQSAFAQAQGGMLFVDHVELLEPKQYSRILQFLESGEITSMVERKTQACGNMVFVFTTTTQDEGLMDWRNTISVELPALEKRPYEEKLRIIKYFFANEAENSGCKIIVDTTAIRRLLMIDYNQGIKGIMNAVKAACASAYIRVLDDDSEVMHVGDQDFPEEIFSYFKPLGVDGVEIDVLLGSANYMVFGDKENDDTSGEATEVYGQLKDQYQGMLDRGITAAAVKSVIDSYLENIQFDIPKNNTAVSSINMGQLSQLVEANVINYVSLFAERYKHEYGRELSDNMFCGLCLHINSILKKENISKHRINDEQVKAIIQHYPREYATMLEFAHVLYERFYLKLSIEETAILAMFIIDTKNDNEAPVLLYVMHGEGVATGLAEVANATTGEDNAFGLDLNVSEDAANINDLLEKKIKEIDCGGGVIVIYDSSAIKVMLENISERTGIKIREMIFPITSVGVNVARNCKRERDIDRAYHNSRKNIDSLIQGNKRPKAIITLCHTSEGGADQLKNYINRYSKLEMPVFALAMSNKDKLVKEVMDIKKSYKIHAFVGTFDPELFGIPFVSIADVFECSKADLDHVLMFETVQKKYIGYEKVIENYGREAQHLTVERLRKYVPDVVEQLALAYDLEADERVGLCAHMVYMLDALSSPDYKTKGIDSDKYLQRNTTDYKVITNFLRPLEKAFKVIINDEEISTLMRILKKQH